MKRLALRPDAILRARTLRRDMTPQERKLWRALKENFPNAHFRKQVPMGLYTADFAWHTAKLIIEVDGGQHGTDAGKSHDTVRTRYIEAQGYRVIRFWNNEVDQNLEGVIATIADALPPVGRVEWGPAASAAERLGDHLPIPSPQNYCAADAARPHPNPPHKGEGNLSQTSFGVR